jgi:hypothetical protein
MIVAATLAVMTIGPASAQNNWTNFGQDPGATKFSTLDQINDDNVTNLKRAWTFHTATTPDSSRAACCVIDGVMYFSAQNGVLRARRPRPASRSGSTKTTGRRGAARCTGPAASGVGPRIFSQTVDGLAAIDPKRRQAHHELRREGASSPVFG